jgi:DNA repair exonuclease SbcCD ATPase subunit
MTDPKPDSEMLSNESEMLDVAVEEQPFDKDRAMETIKKLRENEKALKKQAAELEKYRKAEEERKQAEMSETERLQAELAKAQAELKASQMDVMKRQAAAATGLPPAFADRLKGETLEELEADAKVILEALPKPKAAPNSGATNPGENGKPEETWAQKKQRLMGQPGSIWDGGGVIWGPNDTP